MVKIKKQLVSNAIANRVSYKVRNKKKWLVVHQTGNTTKGAGAKAHADLQSRGNSRNAGWHWQVDDQVAIQSIPHEKSAYHAGSYTGNTESIGVEHTVNVDADYKKVLQNGAELVADIMKKENIPLSRVVQHSYWSGKNCPSQLRAGKDGISWVAYKKMVQEAFNGNKPIVPSGNSKPGKTVYKGSIVDYLHQQGLKSNMANRKNLAVEYGVVNKESDYTGTAAQNTALLKAMQSEEPKQDGTRKEPIKSGYTGSSIVDYLVSIKVDNSFSNRKKLASKYGISNYSGSASQNKQLLNAMRGDSKPVKKGVAVGDTVTSRTLYSTSNSTKNVRSSSIKGYVDSINSGWKNEIRLRNKKGGHYLGFTKKKDLI